MTALAGSTAIFIFDTLDLGGAERQGLLLARHLRSCGAHVEIWGLVGAPGAVSRSCDEHGLTWRAVQLPWRRELVRAPSNVLALYRLAAELRARHVDILLPYTFFSNVTASLVWRPSGARLCVWNQRDAGQYLDGFDPWRSAALRLVRDFVANSEQGRRALIDRGIAADRVMVVHNGVELAPPAASRAEWRSRLGARDDQVVVGMVANLHANKDHATLLRAWRRVLDARGSSVPPLLVFAGRIEETGEANRRLAAELDLGDAVRFLGPVDDIAGLYSTLAICVHSAVSEGLPNAVLEAMAAGLPVTATDLPGIRELVGSEGVRWLVPPGDVVALADRLAELLGDASLRARIGAAAVRRATEEFGAPAMCEAMATYLTLR